MTCSRGVSRSGMARQWRQAGSWPSHGWRRTRRSLHACYGYWRAAPPNRFRSTCCSSLQPLASGNRLPAEVAPLLAPLLGDPLTVGDAVAALRRYSLVTPAGEGMVLIHRLVQAVTLDQMPAADAAAWGQAAAALFEAAIPSDKIRPFVTTLNADPPEGHFGGVVQEVYIAEVEASGRKPEISEPRVEIQCAERVVAVALRLIEGAEVVSRHQQRFIDGTPFSLQTSFYPMALVTMGATRLLEATDIQEGVVAYFWGCCGIQQVGYRDTIAIRSPAANEAWFFRLPSDGRIPVVEVHRVSFDADGNRISLTVTVYPADRNRFRIDTGNLPPRLLPHETAATRSRPTRSS